MERQGLIVSSGIQEKESILCGTIALYYCVDEGGGKGGRRARLLGELFFLARGNRGKEREKNKYGHFHLHLPFLLHWQKEASKIIFGIDIASRHLLSLSIF